MNTNPSKPCCSLTSTVRRSRFFVLPPSFLWLFIAGPALATGSQTQLATNNAAHRSTATPLERLGALAGKEYQGDGLTILPTTFLPHGYSMKPTGLSDFRACDNGPREN